MIVGTSREGGDVAGLVGYCAAVLYVGGRKDLW